MLRIRSTHLRLAGHTQHQSGRLNAIAPISIRCLDPACEGKMIYIPPISMPVRAARLLRGTDPAMMVNDPFIKPDVPMPATALPTINMVEDVAAPQISEPISNMAKKPRNDHYWSVSKSNHGLLEVHYSRQSPCC